MKEESIERRRLKNDLTVELTRLEIHAKEHVQGRRPRATAVYQGRLPATWRPNLDQDKNRNKARILNRELNGKECIDETGRA